MEKTTLLICGDILPTAANEAAMAAGKAEELLADVFPLFLSADFVFANIEGALTRRGTPIEKCGPNLRANPAAARFFKDIGLGLAGLGNNHSLDFGKTGLTDTVEALNSLGIATVGAGEDASQARIPYRFSLKGHELSIINVAENEFTIAGPDRAGANRFDPYDTMEDIEREKRDGRTVIVIYHGGKEFYRMTSPETRRRMRKMAEHGADFVFCQHTHCVCCYEEYQGCHICYGQGNTLFDLSQDECWKTEILPVITLTEEGGKSVEYIPVCQDSGRLHLAKGEEAESIMKPFRERSALVLEDDYLEESWKEFARQEGRELFSEVGWVDGEGNPIKPELLSRLSNYFRCEIHKETCLSALEELRKQEFGERAVKGQ